MSGRILWLALADGRGHLMRAQLLHRALASRGVEVELLTTSDEGAAFLGAFGLRANVLSRRYRVHFDARQNMSRLRTDLGVAQYLADPRQMCRDLGELAERAAEADLVVGDSFHPALMLAPLFPRTRSLRVVHVYGQNLRRALEDNFDGRIPEGLAYGYRAGMRALLARSFARIEHTFAGPWGPSPEAGSYVLPPVIAPSSGDPGRIRATLGVGESGPLAVVYLNPHFRDPAIAQDIEDALARQGLAMYAVGEGYAGRPGWIGRDPALPDAISAADVFLSAPGMAAIGQARAFGVPLVALVTDQPEQRRNVSFLAGHRHAIVHLGNRDLGPRLGQALRALVPVVRAARPDPRPAIERVHSLWADVLLSLWHRARGEADGSIARKEERTWKAA